MKKEYDFDFKSELGSRVRKKERETWCLSTTKLVMVWIRGWCIIQIQSWQKLRQTKITAKKLQQIKFWQNLGFGKSILANYIFFSFQRKVKIVWMKAKMKQHRQVFFSVHLAILHDLAPILDVMVPNSIYQ